MNKYLGNFFTITFVLIILSGCTGNGRSIYEGKHGGDEAEVVLVLKQLAKQDIDFHCRGRSLILAIPTEKIFFERSANFHDKAHEVLSMIAPLVKSRSGMELAVTNYIYDARKNWINHAMALEAAKKVASYLWSVQSKGRIAYAYVDKNKGENNHAKKSNVLMIEFVDFY